MAFNQLLHEWFPEPAKFATRLEGLLLALRAEAGWTWAALAVRSITGSRLTWQWVATAGEAPGIEAVEASLLSVGKHGPGPVSLVVNLAGKPLDLAWSTPLGPFVPASGEHVRCTAVLATSHEPSATFCQEVLPQLALILSEHERDVLANTVLSAVEQAPDAIELTDVDARLVFANDAWLQYFEYEWDDIVGNTSGSLVRDDKVPAHDPAFLQFTMAELTSRRSWLGALGSRSRTGARRFNEAMVAPFEAPTLGLRGNFAIRRDLKHRASRDAALAQTHKEFRAVLAALPDAVVVLRERTIYFANDAFLHLCGRTLTEVIGLDFRTLVQADEWSGLMNDVEHNRVRVRIVTPDRTVRVAEVSVAGDVSFEGSASRILVARDVTEHLLSREQYVRNDRLAAIGSLAVGIAHEVNNPLAYVMLNLEMLQSEVVTQVAKDTVSEALDGARRIRKIVSELRGFWHGDAQPEPTALDLATAITSAVNLAQNEVRHRADLVRRLEPELMVIAREGHIVQVLVNLLLYAAHSIPDAPGEQHKITITTRSLSETRLEVSISGTGCVISNAELGSVFDPFGVVEPGDSSGLGLAVTRRIVLDELGGQIAVATDGVRGATFRIELPRAALVEAGAESRKSHPQLLQSPFRVLVVDDEPLIARAIKRALNACVVQTASDGVEALSLLAKERDFDVVLCDLMMPRVSGAEVFRRVNEEHPTLASSFVFMTGGAFSDWSRQFLQMVERPVIAKPFEPAELRACVEKVATKVRRTRMLAR